jgi:tetratricopeptide (TPR) repeat protein
MTSTPRIDALRSFLEQDPHDSFSRYALALELRSTGELDSAIETLEQLRRIDPSYVPLYYQLGAMYRHAGRPGDARTAYVDGLRESREARDAHTAMELQEALDELESA